MRFPIGVSNFKELIEGQYYFADKTLFVKEVMQDGAKVILVTRPRRFGKTLNLSMLYYFFRKNHSDNEKLFDGLKVSEDLQFCKEHQQQYPVIFISFKDIKKSNYGDAYADIVALIKELYGEHRYLLEGDVLHEDEKNTFKALLNENANQSNIESAIKKLSNYMARKFKKAPIILIDEYDTPIQEAYLHDYYDEMITLMRGIFGQALKDNPDLHKAIITGITRISQGSLFSGLNNLAVYSLLREKFGQYFGFTEEEVLKFIEDNPSISFSALKEWYNGYQVGKYVLYNPWSILSCLANNGILKPYWINTSTNGLITKLLSNADLLVKQQFEELLQGKVVERPLSEDLVFADIETKESALWSLLLYAGYLKVLSSEFHDYRLLAKIAIPNKEISFLYSGIVADWFVSKISLDSYELFVKSLADGDMDKFKMFLSTYIMQTGSYFDFSKNTPEEIFHVFILGLVVGLRNHYIINSNQESGLGRFDVVFIPKDKNRNGILLEFKTSDTPDLLLPKAQEALEQIKDRKYVEIFKQHNVPSVLAIGLAFCGKQMELVYENLSLI